MNPIRYFCNVAGRIAALRNMGFGLAAIGEILRCYDNPQALVEFLTVKQAEVQDNVYEFNDMMFCIYHVNPAQTQNPDEYVSVICYAVKNK